MVCNIQLPLIEFIFYLKMHQGHGKPINIVQRCGHLIVQLQRLKEGNDLSQIGLSDHEMMAPKSQLDLIIKYSKCENMDVRPQLEHGLKWAKHYMYAQAKEIYWIRFCMIYLIFFLELFAASYLNVTPRDRLR